MRALVLYVVCSALFAAALLGTSPLPAVAHHRNTTAYSSDLRYCVEVHQPAGIGGCLIPQGRSEAELTRVAEANDKRPLKQQLAEFDFRHSAVRGFPLLQTELLARCQQCDMEVLLPPAR